MDKVLLLTPEEVAEMLRVNFRTVHKLIKDGELKAFKVGHQWRIPSEAVDAMLERNASSHAKS
jgi:excisionase family DNA binding protein